MGSSEPVLFFEFKKWQGEKRTDIMNKYKVKNVSTGTFILTLGAVTKGKKFELLPNHEAPLTDEEMAYLSVECQGAFERGYLQLVSKPQNATIDIPKSENILSDEEMVALLDSTPKKIKGGLDKITETHVLKALRLKAEEMNKSSTVIDAIDKRIGETATSAVL